MDKLDMDDFPNVGALVPTSLLDKLYEKINNLEKEQDNLVHDNSELLNSLNLTVEDNLKLEQERDDYQDKYSRLKMMHLPSADVIEVMAHNMVLTDQLKRLQYRLQERFEWVLGTITQDLQAEYEKSLDIIEQTPMQSLAEIQAKAIEDAVFDADTVTITSAIICSLSDYVSYLKDYAGKIRAQAKEGAK